MSKEIDPKEVQRCIDAAMIAALPTLITPLVNAVHAGKGLTAIEVRAILRHWDKARMVTRS